MVLTFAWEVAPETYSLSTIENKTLMNANSLKLSHNFPSLQMVKEIKGQNQFFSGAFNLRGYAKTVEGLLVS